MATTTAPPTTIQGLATYLDDKLKETGNSISSLIDRVSESTTAANAKLTDIQNDPPPPAPNNGPSMNTILLIAGAALVAFFLFKK